MVLPDVLRRTRLPMIGAPLFIISGIDLVLAQCKAGVIGSFPSLNARPAQELDKWLQQITTALATHQAAHPDAIVAPFAVNLIAHHSNDRLGADLDTCVAHQVPIIITSLQAPRDLINRVHAYGGIVLHDVVNIRHAHKALDDGVDGLIAVCAGAGGHAGALSPFALVSEIRAFFAGPLVLSGAISHGAMIVAAQAMGADMVYLGTRFIATREANAATAYKNMIVESSAADIVYSSLFSGVHGNYLKPSVRAAGLDPDHLPQGHKSTMNFADLNSGKIKVWRDIWGAGQGVGTIVDAPSVDILVHRLHEEYRQAGSMIAAQFRC